MLEHPRESPTSPESQRLPLHQGQFVAQGGDVWPRESSIVTVRPDNAGYPWNGHMTVPHGRYYPSMGQTPVPGFGWNDPVLTTVQRKRSATRKVSLSSGVAGIITMSVQMITSTTLFVTSVVPKDPSLEFTFLDFIGLLAMIFTPFIVGLGWIATFILALIACIKAHSRTPRVQPDGWDEAKMPTSALLAASIVAGLPAVISYVTLFLEGSSGSSAGGTDYFMESVLITCDLVQALIAVGVGFLLRMSRALDPSVRAPQAPGTQFA